MWIGYSGPSATPAEVRSRDSDEARPGEVPMMPVTLPLPPPGEQTPRRILVADDNEMLRSAFRGLLQGLGHTVDVVTNGREAVELVAREIYDLVFLDIQMPVMDGFEAALSIRPEPAGVRVPRIIGVSAESEERESCSSRHGRLPNQAGPARRPRPRHNAILPFLNRP